MGARPLASAANGGASVNIFGFQPYSLVSNLGAEYNRHMELIGEDDWAVLTDHDAIPGLDRNWFRYFAEAIAFRPEAGAFVAVTNRIDAFWQRAEEADRDNHDIEYHTAIALKRATRRTLLDITDTKGFGGVSFALSKAAWRDAGGFADGLLCVDHSIHFGLQRAGRRVYLLENVYVYHRRRAVVGKLPDSTPRVANCPCRGPEPTPTERIALPELVTA